jgi:hypothetical protein
MTYAAIQKSAENLKGLDPFFEPQPVIAPVSG